MRIFKQHKVGKTWGYILQVAQQGGLVTQIIMLTIQIITLASVLQLRGIMVPVWLLGLLAFGILGTTGIILYKFGNPSYFSAWSEQFYKHDNPMRRDIEENKKMLKEIKGQLVELRNEKSN